MLDVMVIFRIVVVYLAELLEMLHPNILAYEHFGRLAPGYMTGHGVKNGSGLSERDVLSPKPPSTDLRHKGVDQECD